METPEEPQPRKRRLNLSDAMDAFYILVIIALCLGMWHLDSRLNQRTREIDDHAWEGVRTGNKIESMQNNQLLPGLINASQLTAAAAEAAAAADAKAQAGLNWSLDHYKKEYLPMVQAQKQFNSSVTAALQTQSAAIKQLQAQQGGSAVVTGHK